MNISDKIKEQIRETALRLEDEGIVTVEGMIPLLDHTAYLRKGLDIPYGDRTEKEKLDIFYPEEGEGPFPVFVEVHGGAWYFGQKGSVEFEPFLLGLERGFACVSLGYTLSPQGHYPLPVLEIKSAIRFLRANAPKYHLDPDRILLWGGSAGAHLAALAAASCDTGYLTEDLSGNEAYSAKPNALALWYGCFDYFENGRDLEDWIYENFLGVENLDAARETLRLMSPLTHLTEAACPTLLQHGTADGVVPYTQSVGYLERLRAVAGEDRGCLELFEGCDHADARLFARENVERVFDFAREQWQPEAAT